MIGRGDDLLGPEHFDPALFESLECLGAGDLVDEMSVDIEHRGAAIRYLFAGRSWRSQIFSNNVFGMACLSILLRRNDAPGVGMGQLVKVFFHDFFFGVCYLQEPLVYGVDIVAVEGVADLLETEGQRAAAAAGCQHDAGPPAPTSSGLMIS